jgi:hypothetical protein
MTLRDRGAPSVPTYPHGQIAIRAHQILTDDWRQHLEQAANSGRDLILDQKRSAFFAVQISLINLLDLIVGQVRDFLSAFEILMH